jgi:hypothetical protein
MLAAMEGLLAGKRRRWPGVPSGRADLHVHSIWSDGAQRARAFALDHPELGVDVVVGEEISTLNGHLIGLYLSERVRPGLSADETIALIHAQGGLAVAALRNVEWMLPVTGSSDAHDVWYLGSAATHFAGWDAQALRRALVTQQTRARVNWSWSVGKLPRHVRIQSRSAVRFLRLWGERKAAQWPG